MGAITAKELAARLHLSESAVSLALNDKAGVSRETRKRVLEAAKEYGYDFTRKAVARDQKNGIVCFAVYRKSGAVVGDTPFFSELTDGVSISCRREGYECVIRYLYEDEDLEDQIYELQISKFAGVIVLATEMEERTLPMFDRMQIPLVFLDKKLWENLGWLFSWKIFQIILFPKNPVVVHGFFSVLQVFRPRGRTRHQDVALSEERVSEQSRLLREGAVDGAVLAG